MPAITNVNELQAMNNNLAGTYWLANDIDASTTVGWNGGAGFVPIGTLGSVFTGSFLGRTHKIYDLYINRPTTNYIGLFGKAVGTEENKVIVKDVTFGNPIISGKDYVGALMGEGSNCLFQNVEIIATTINSEDYSGGLIGHLVLSSNLVKCSTSGEIVATKNTHGGLAGRISGDGLTVERCHSSVNLNIQPNGYYAGGLVGIVFGGSFSQCFAIGNIDAKQDAGGLFGSLFGDVTDCYARGSVSCTSVSNYAGGLTAYLWEGTVQDCYSTGQVVHNNPVGIGGLCAYNDAGTIINSFWDTQTSGTAVSDGGTGKTTAQMKARSTFISAGWDFIVIWGINGITNDGYPFHWAMPPEPPPDAPRRTVLVEDKIPLESIRNVEMAAMGKFRIGENGKAIYRSRYARNP